MATLLAVPKISWMLPQSLFEPSLTKISSGAISILMTLRKQWHCGSVFLGGVYMGVKNRYTEHGLETEALALPDALYERIVFAAENLAKIV